MIEIIANFGCSKCKQAAQTLKRNNINFSYKLITEMTKDKVEKYKDKAIKAGQQNFPIIIKEGELVKLEDVI